MANRQLVNEGEVIAVLAKGGNVRVGAGVLRLDNGVLMYAGKPYPGSVFDAASSAEAGAPMSEETVDVASEPQAS